MKVLLVTFYDCRCSGLRILASLLQENNFDVSLCIIKEHTTKTVSHFSESHYAYQIISDNGYQIMHIDASPISEKEKRIFLDYIKEFKPDVIGFSLRSYLNTVAIKMMKEVKSSFPDVSIICGGFGPTLEPELFTPVADAVVRGEGEEAIVEVCTALRDGGSLRGISNVSVQYDNQCINNPLRAPAINISKYPWPFSFHNGDDKIVLIDKNQLSYGDPLKYWQAYCFLLGRGCLGSCSYCSGGQWSKLYWNSGYKIPKRRLRDIDEAIRELERAKNDGYSRIHFTDEYFAASLPYLDEFLDQYEKKINLPVEMYLHYILINHHPYLAKRLADLGLKKVCIGVQCGDESFAKKIYNRNFSHSEILTFAHIMKKLNISFDVHLIIGNPLEDEKTFRNSLKFLKEIPFENGRDSLTCFRFTPFPQSDIVNRFGNIVRAPMQQTHFERQGCLAQLRMLLDDKDFFPLLDNPVYFEHPEILKNEFYKLKKIRLA